MTQAERFLQFVQHRRNLASPESRVLVRIQENELVITHHWLLPPLAQSVIDPISLGAPAACKRN